MIENPKCIFSNTDANNICISGLCELYPFMCTNCRQNDCQKLHIHKKSLQSMNWFQFSSIIDKIKPKLQQENRRLKLDLKKKLEVGIKKIQDVINAYFPLIVDIFLELDFHLRVQNSIINLKNNQFKDIIGRDLKLLQQIYESKDMKINRKHIQQQIKKKKTSIINSIQTDLLSIINKRLETFKKQQYLQNYQLDKLNQRIYVNSNNYEDFFKRGVMLQQFYRYQQAIQDFTKALSLYPNFTQAYEYRAITNRLVGRIKEAQLDYSKVIQMNPSNSFGYNNRGVFYKHINEFEKALLDLNKAIQLKWWDALYFENRSLVYRQLKRYQQARQDEIMVNQLKVKQKQMQKIKLKG